MSLFLQVLEDHSRPVLSLAIADNKLFSGSYDYTIKVWSLDTLQRLKTLTGEAPIPATTRLTRLASSEGYCACWVAHTLWRPCPACATMLDRSWRGAARRQCMHPAWGWEHCICGLFVVMAKRVILLEPSTLASCW
jgi:hypothetical protein